MKYLLVSLILTAGTLLMPTAAHGQTCLPTAFTQLDMSGIWQAIDGPVRLTIYPCGGTLLEWTSSTNYRGVASYVAYKPLVGGGYVAAISKPDPVAGTPWGTLTVAYKPSIPGQIQIWFWTTQLIEYNAVRVADPYGILQ